MALWIEYARYVGRAWWGIVVGAVGGILFLLSLVTSFVLPLWVGIAILIVGLAIAQFMVFAKMRGEREQVQKELDEARMDPRLLLKRCYQDGHNLEALFTFRRGKAMSETEHEVIENENKADVYAWTKVCWEVLQEHFPGREHALIGEQSGSVAMTALFNLYCEDAIQRHNAGSIDFFMEEKLKYVAEVAQYAERR
jgi:hypothetical protein